jgi:hypothetical protein
MKLLEAPNRPRVPLSHRRCAIHRHVALVIGDGAAAVGTVGVIGLAVIEEEGVVLLGEAINVDGLSGGCDCATDAFERLHLHDEVGLRRTMGGESGVVIEFEGGKDEAGEEIL